MIGHYFSESAVENEFPLGALADTLDFVIRIRPGDAYAEGWFLAKDRRVTFDAARGVITRTGREIRVGEDAFITSRLKSRRELYVARTALNKAWPVNLNVDLAGLRVAVNPTEPLPIQRERRRERRRERLLRGRNRNLDLRKVPNAYALVSRPTLDITSELTVEDGGFNTTHDFTWSHDLLGAASEGRIAVRTQGAAPSVTDARLTFRRSDFVSELPWTLKDLRAGDVSRRSLTNVGGLRRGRGVVISGFPVKRSEAFDTTTIDGNAPAGFEAELYRNGQLLRFQDVGEDGRFAFTDVQLLFGSNRFRIALFGPQGQKRERFRTIDTSRVLARPGRTAGRLSLIQVGRDCLPVAGDSGEGRSGLGATAVLVHGLSLSTSLFSAITRTPTKEGPRHYAVGGINAAFGPASGQLRLLTSAQGGFGANLQLLGTVGPVRTNISGQYFSAFDSPSVGFDGEATSYQVNVKTNTPVHVGQHRINLTMESTLQEQRNGERTISLRTSQRTAFGDIRVSNALRRTLGETGRTGTRGTLRTNTRWSRFRLRAGVDYALPVDATNLRANLRYRGTDRFSLGAQVQRNLQKATTGLGVDATRTFGPLLSSLTASWREDTGISFGVRFETGFLPQPGGGYDAVPQGASEGGVAAANVFVDRDADGTRDPDERPVSGAELGRDARRAAPTDEDGRTLVRGLAPFRPQTVTVRAASLKNPFWLPAHEGYSVIPRPGRVPEIRIPVVRTGAIDGTVRRAASDAPILNVPLKLVEPDGDVVAEKRTSYGGFFAFDQVRYGTYAVRLGDTDRWRLKQPVEVTIGHKKPIASGTTVRVVRRDAQGEKP